MNAGTLERLRAHVLPGVRGARTLLYDLRLASSNIDEWRVFRRCHATACALERELRALLHKARAERNAKVAKTRRTG